MKDEPHGKVSHDHPLGKFCYSTRFSRNSTTRRMLLINIGKERHVSYWHHIQYPLHVHYSREELIEERRPLWLAWDSIWSPSWVNPTVSLLSWEACIFEISFGSLLSGTVGHWDGSFKLHVALNFDGINVEIPLFSNTAASGWRNRGRHAQIKYALVSITDHFVVSPPKMIGSSSKFRL